MLLSNTPLLFIWGGCYGRRIGSPHQPATATEKSRRKEGGRTGVGDGGAGGGAGKGGGARGGRSAARARVGTGAALRGPAREGAARCRSLRGASRLLLQVAQTLRLRVWRIVFPAAASPGRLRKLKPISIARRRRGGLPAFALRAPGGDAISAGAPQLVRQVCVPDSRGPPRGGGVKGCRSSRHQPSLSSARRGARGSASGSALRGAAPTQTLLTQDRPPFCVPPSAGCRDAPQRQLRQQEL